MTITVGSQEVQGLYVGSTPVQAVYVGSTQVWPTIPPASWVRIDLPVSGYWQAICYGGNKFVAIARVSNTAAYSIDGIHWTATTMPSTADWYAVTYGNNMFVAVANDGDLGVQKAAYSTDGINWTASTLPRPRTDVWYDWRSVAYGNGKFIAISSAEVFAVSTNGTTWSAVADPTGNQYHAWTRIRYLGNRFVLTSRLVDKIWYSTDGSTWSNATLPATGEWSDVMYDGTKYIAIRGGYPAYSYDNCATWAYSGTEDTTSATFASYGGGYYCTAGNFTLPLRRSFDGISWDWAGISTSGMTMNTFGLAYGAGKHVFVTGQGTAAWYYNTGASS